MSAVKQAVNKFKSSKMLYKRPPDYLAEMMKSDVHMARVKTKILHEQKAIDLVEQRKRRQSGRKFAKKAHAEKLKSRALKKKTDMSAIHQWKQGGFFVCVFGDSVSSRKKKIYFMCVCCFFPSFFCCF